MFCSLQEMVKIQNAFLSDHSHNPLKVVNAPGAGNEIWRYHGYEIHLMTTIELGPHTDAGCN